MNTETSTHDTGSFNLKEKIGYSIAGLVVIGGSFFIVRHIIRQARAVSEEKKTFTEDNPATYAKQIKMAFDNDMPFGWGTNKEALRKTIQAVPSKEEFKKTINSYQKLYTRSMMADMQDELTSTEYNEMLAIIGAKPDKGSSPIKIQSASLQFEEWAKRLKAAFDITYWGIPGTDEKAIKAVFLEMTTQSDFWQTANSYQKLYGDELVKDLKSELEFWEYQPMMNIILKKPK